MLLKLVLKPCVFNANKKFAIDHHKGVLSPLETEILRKTRLLCLELMFSIQQSAFRISGMRHPYDLGHQAYMSYACLPYEII